jgi:hypothetical protein
MITGETVKVMRRMLQCLVDMLDITDELASDKCMEEIKKLPDFKLFLKGMLQVQESINSGLVSALTIALVQVFGHQVLEGPALTFGSLAETEVFLSGLPVVKPSKIKKLLKGLEEPVPDVNLDEVLKKANVDKPKDEETT